MADPARCRPPPAFPTAGKLVLQSCGHQCCLWDRDGWFPLLGQAARSPGPFISPRSWQPKGCGSEGCGGEELWLGTTRCLYLEPRIRHSAFCTDRCAGSPGLLPSHCPHPNRLSPPFSDKHCRRQERLCFPLVPAAPLMRIAGKAGLTDTLPQNTPEHTGFQATGALCCFCTGGCSGQKGTAALREVKVVQQRFLPSEVHAFLQFWLWNSSSRGRKTAFVPRPNNQTPSVKTSFFQNCVKARPLRCLLFPRSFTPLYSTSVT